MLSLLTKTNKNFHNMKNILIAVAIGTVSSLIAMLAYKKFFVKDGAAA